MSNLVELLVAIMVFTLCLTSSALVFKESKKIVAKNKQLEQTINIVNSQAEALSILPFNKLSNQTFANGQGKVKVSYLSSSLCQIELELNGTRLATLRSQHD